MGDSERIDHITSRTTAPREFWAKKAVTSKLFEFGSNEALALGIIHNACPFEEWYR